MAGSNNTGLSKYTGYSSVSYNPPVCNYVPSNQTPFSNQQRILSTPDTQPVLTEDDDKDLIASSAILLPSAGAALFGTSFVGNLLYHIQAKINGDYPNMRDKLERLNSFKSWMVTYVSPVALANAGFYFKHKPDHVCCAYCGLDLQGWERGDDPKQQHRKHGSPTCPFQSAGFVESRVLAKSGTESNSSSSSSSEDKDENFEKGEKINEKEDTWTTVNKKVDMVVTTSRGQKAGIQKRTVLGHGAFGIVYSAKITDEKIPEAVARLCAVKYFSSPKIDAQQDEKIRAIMKLNHLHVVRFFCYGPTTSRQTKKKVGDEYNWCIVQELCEDGTLHKKAKMDWMCPQTVHDYTTQILLGVQYLHNNRIIHTDLKGDNIFLMNGFKQIKIGDLDDSIILNGPFTVTNDVRREQGTLRWMSPEMLQLKYTDGPRSPVGRSADVWSLGCVILEMLTKADFTLLTSSDGECIVSNEHQILVAKEGYYPCIPATLARPLQETLRMCFRKDPKMRSSCNEILKSPHFKQWMCA